MNSKSVIFFCPPYLTVTPTFLSFGSVLVDSDIHSIFSKAFKEYKKFPFFSIDWLQQDGLLRVNLDSVEKTFEKARKVSDVVTFIFVWNCNPKDFPRMSDVFARIDDYKSRGNKIEIISMIPDSWYGGSAGQKPEEYKEFIQSHTNVCDKVITFCDSCIPFLKHIGATEIAKKMHYVPFLPIVLNEHKFENKVTDLCFIGTVRGARRTAFDTIINAFPEMSKYLYDNGRSISRRDDYLAKYQDYLDKLGESVYSVMTSTRPAFEKDNFLFSSVVPGRFCESLVNLTIPIYFQENENDFLPSPVDEYDCCIYIKAEDTKEQVIEKIKKLPIETIRNNMMNFYNDHVNPKIVLPKIMDLNYER